MYEEELRILNNPEEMKKIILKGNALPSSEEAGKQFFRFRSFCDFLGRSQMKEDWYNLYWYSVDREGYFARFFAPSPFLIPRIFFQMDIREYMLLYDFFDEKWDQYSDIMPKVIGMYDYFGDDDKKPDIYSVSNMGATEPTSYLTLRSDIGEIISRVRYDGLFSQSDTICVKDFWDDLC